MAHLVGLSLSRCVRDILAGDVNEYDVIKIVTNTAARDDYDWDKLVQDYASIYWDAWYRATAIALIERLRARGQIEQPRVDNPDYIHYLTEGHWRTEADPFSIPPITHSTI